MLVDIELAMEAWKLLNSNTELKAMINGSVYNRTRPFNSQSQDIVVNCLGASSGVVQFSTIIINCFIPDIQIEQSYYADGNKLAEVAKKVIEIFTDSENPQLGIFLTEKKIYFEYESQRTYQSKEQENWHVISLRFNSRNLIK